MPPKPSKICKFCNTEHPVEKFVSVEGEFNIRAKNCLDCYLKDINENRSSDKSWSRDADNAYCYIYGLQKKFGEEWLSHVLPYAYFLIARSSTACCSYCGDNWGIRVSEAERKIWSVEPVMEHMDPLALGGQDTPANIAISCVACNSKKGRMTFEKWLTKLSPDFAEKALGIYRRQLGRDPSSFVQSPAPEHRKPSFWAPDMTDLNNEATLRIFILGDDSPELKEKARLEKIKNDRRYTEQVLEAKANAKPFPWHT